MAKIPTTSTTLLRDIIQETLVAPCRALPSYRYAPDEKGHFHNYLTGILRNKALRQLRKDRQRAEFTADLQRTGTKGVSPVAFPVLADPRTPTNHLISGALAASRVASQRARAPLPHRRRGRLR